VNIPPLTAADYRQVARQVSVREQRLKLLEAAAALDARADELEAQPATVPPHVSDTRRWS
jgi:hypothetical protein